MDYVLIFLSLLSSLLFLASLVNILGNHQQRSKTISYGKQGRRIGAGLGKLDSGIDKYV